MSASTDARLIHLILFPYTAPIPAAPPAGPRAAQPSLTKQAPYFLELDLELVELDQVELVVEGVAVILRRQMIDGQIMVAECAYTLTDFLNPDSSRRKQSVQAKLHEQVLSQAGYRGAFVEEYTIVCLPDAAPGPDEFVHTHRHALAALLRSLSHPIAEPEVEKILGSRARYTDRDLTIVDWEGALIVDQRQDFRSDIELLKIGNHELLRYRLLDRAIERNLETVRRALDGKRRLRLFDSLVRETLQRRLELLLDFEKTEQLLLLIGDWYSAQLYRVIVDEFYIDDWKATVRAKLDQLESITDTIRANFSLSWDQFLDLVQLIGWLILLVGYFVLFYLDIVAAVR
jgi:hypothetical protein